MTTRHTLALLALTALLVGCGATAPQPAVPPPSPSPSPSPSPVAVAVAVPAVSDKINAKLLLADPKLVMQRTEELPLAPDTFAIIGNEIVINDYLQDEIAIYRGGKRATAFTKPTTIVDMAIRDGKWYLLDTDSVVTIYTRTAKGLKKVRETQLAEPETGWQALYFEGPNLIAYNGENRVLAEGPGPVLEDPQIAELDHAMHLTDGDTNAIIPVKYDRQEVERIALTDQYVFYEISDVNTESDDSPSRHFIVQFTLDGQFVHTYAYYRPGSPAELRDFVVADGKLYQMWISSKTVKVFLIEPND